MKHPYILKFVHSCKHYYSEFYKGVILQKKEFFFFLVAILLFLFLQVYLWAFGLVLYGIVYFSSKRPSKPISLYETLILRYKKNVLNRKYLRIKYFWKHNFREPFLKLKFSQRLWHLPLLLSISFYNAITTKYIILTTIFYARCSILIFVFENPKGWFIILAYFLPLVLITQLCGMPPIAGSLNRTYGKTTIKKLGFNIFNAFMHSHGVKIGAALVGGMVGVGGFNEFGNAVPIRAVKANTAIIDNVNDANLQIWEKSNHPHLHTPPERPKTIFVTKEDVNQWKKEATLPELKTLFKWTGLDKGPKKDD